MPRQRKEKTEATEGKAERAGPLAASRVEFACASAIDELIAAGIEKLSHDVISGESRG
jgi:hypothetical protein